MTKLINAFKKIGTALSVISIVALLIMVCLTIADVFLRTFFKAPIPGTVEIARMMMVTMTPCFTAVLMRNMHVDVGLLVDKFKPNAQLAFAAFGHVLSAIVCVLMCYQGFMDMAKKMSQHQVYTMLKIPTWPFYMIFAIAMGFFAVAIVVKLIDKIIRKDVVVPEEKEDGEVSA
ncbi:MAG: TRAP transporter small permease [Eubacterium sp.]|nr:TRAP transporter small permease [Eubacterium sp.]